ncbi:hypothetical protein HYV30_01505 [Candidatus Kaiserbacteria bacterium]|nr:hypothetical protein [Candidatus Kaiserbacteria bacterium]
MEKFLVLYKARAAEMEKMMRDTTPEEREKGMGEWNTWFETHKKEVAEMGAPLGEAKRVDPSGTTDGKNEIGGYSIVQAGSLDAAAKLFSREHPHFSMPSAWIEVIQIMPTPEM